MHLRLFPLNTVLFPGAPLSLHVFEPRYKQMIAECLDSGEAFGVTLIREGDEAGDPTVMPHEIGTTAEIADVRPLPEGRFFINTVGRRRFKIERIVSREPYLLAEVTVLDEPDEAPTPEQHEAEGHVRKEFAEYMRLLVEFSGARSTVELADDPQAASYAIANALQVADAMKQHLLELPNAAQRLAMESAFLRKLLPQLRSLLERKRRTAAPLPTVAAPGATRSQQEKLFGKYFSLN